MSGLGPAVICVVFILNEKTTEKDTNDLLYTEPDNLNFERKKEKEKAQQLCVSLLLEDSILMKWRDSTRFLTRLPYLCIYLFKSIVFQR